MNDTVNDTLRKIRAEAERSQACADSGKASSLELAQRRSLAAKPLLDAFAEVQEAFVRIDVLKDIWPQDYHQRPDRARGLVSGVHGGEGFPCGISLYIPGGQTTFRVETTWDGKLLYVFSRDIHSTQPRSWTFEKPEPWLQGFYQTMATLLEI